MVGSDPRLGTRGGVMLALMILWISSAHGFPLHGGNEVVNATVYGVMNYEYGDGIYIDLSAEDSDVYSVELIGGNNKTYGGDSGPYRSTLHGFPTETAYNGAIRDMLLFNVPKDVIIKSLRVAPHNSDPFYVNWTDVPEVTDGNSTLRFYGATFELNGMRWRQGNWNFDVNLTNNSNRTLEYKNSDYAMVDQFGWVYRGEEDNELEKILPEQSKRFVIKVPLVSEIARPMAILFKGMKLDISAWA
jgi:hypothetical protein